MDKYPDLIFNLQDGSYFKILDVDYNSLSELKKADLIGIFEVISIEKSRFNLFSTKISKIRVRNLMGRDFSLVPENDRLVIYNENINGVDIHGRVTDIESLDYGFKFDS
jgi:hypothetical protein